MPKKASPRRPPEKPDEREAEFEPQRNDPLASLRWWSVDIVVDGDVLTIGKQPAAAWLFAILTDDLSSLLDAADRSMFDERIADGADASDTFSDAIEAISGRPWYIAVRLASLWLDDQVRGEILGHVDVTSTPFAAVLDVTYALMVRNLDSEKRAEFENELKLDPDLATNPRSMAQQMRERARASGTPSAPTQPRTASPPPTPHPGGEPSEPTPPPPVPLDSDPDR